MGGFLYFLSNTSPADRAAAVQRCGLAGVLDARKAIAREVPAGGPDGQRGVVLGCAAAWADQGGQVAYVPAIQTWEPIGGTEGPSGEPAAWIGWMTATPPGPAELARPEQIDGHAIELADGNTWLMPVARALDGHTKLPRALRIGPGGGLVSHVLPRYAAIWGRAQSVWMSLAGQLAGAAETGTQIQLAIEDGWRLAVDALGLNYRVGPAEVSALGLLTTTNVELALGALVDWPTLLSEAKKKAAN